DRQAGRLASDLRRAITSGQPSRPLATPPAPGTHAGGERGGLARTRHRTMRFSHFFINRPIFAGVIAIIITIVGAFAYFGLAVSQYPDVVPPTVTVSANYPGASAETV